MSDGPYYARRAQEELELAALASDRDTKATHLNRAARFATLRERTETPPATLAGDVERD